MTLWGGRFGDDPDEALWRFTADPTDRRLLVDDVTGSMAHVVMLGDVGLLTAAETERLGAGLEEILVEAREGRFEFDDGDEDVHSAVERRLGELVGEVAGKLHTGRSRNDQVALDLRLYLRRVGAERVAAIDRLTGVLVDAAERAGEAIVPSYTHLQQAQAVPLAHHLLAHAWALLRDVERFEEAAGRIEVSPLGAGASGGSMLPLDPGRVAAELGLPRVFANSFDAVSSRDFVAEYVFCCGQTMTHLSRLAEDLVLWSTAEFGWATFGDAHTTGSSALPQKKNPDIAELARGKTASVIGDVTTVLTLEKGLPMTYNRDLQEDKRALFHADDTLGLALEALAGLVAGASFHPPPVSSWVTALDLAETLVARGVPFRLAHRAIGGLVMRLVAEGRHLGEVTADELTATHDRLGPDDVALLSPETSVRRRRTRGGGSFESVADQIAEIRTTLTGR